MIQTLHISQLQLHLAVSGCFIIILSRNCRNGLPSCGRHVNVIITYAYEFNESAETGVEKGGCGGKERIGVDRSGLEGT